MKKPTAPKKPTHVTAAAQHQAGAHDHGIHNPGPQAAVAGETFDLHLRTTKAARAFKAIGLPDGLSINPKNGNISGTVALPAAPIDVTVTCEDLQGHKVEVTFTIEVL